MTRSKKGCNSVKSNMYRILPNVNQSSTPWAQLNIMILAQGILEIFCSQGLLWVKCLSLKKGINQSNVDRIL